MSTPVSQQDVKAVRAFNRFYTRQSGVLDPYLGSEFSLTEVRVLYELAHRDQPTATELGRDLALDAGYLSRILRRFEQKGWLERAPSPADSRQSLLKLTQAGHDAFAPMQQRSRDEASAMLSRLDEAGRSKLTAAMSSIESLLSPATSPDKPKVAVLRELRAGDLGWVVQQHGEVYWNEYGWNAEFEALVAGIIADYQKKLQPEWERGWMAEVDGQRVGCVFVVRKSATVAQLRLLILSPAARGMGLGARLTDECMNWAKAKGYKKMVLWTNSGLTAARSIYAKRGFKLVKSEPYHGFGHDLVGETWETKLT